MITKTYPIVCPSCNGSGQMSNPNFNPNVTSSSQIADCVACVACNRTGVVMMTETTTNETPTFLTSSSDKREII